MKVPAQQSSCVVLSAIFFSTTISSQDSIKYLEDLDAERWLNDFVSSSHTVTIPVDVLELAAY